MSASITIALLVAAATPTTVDLCGSSFFSLEVVSQPLPSEEAMLLLPSRDGSGATDAVVYEGEKVQVWIRGEQYRQVAAHPISVVVTANNVPVATKDLTDWSTGRESNAPGLGSFWSRSEIVLPSRLAGTYELRVRPSGCGIEFRQHYGQYVRLTVRQIITGDDRAALAMANARRLAFVEKNCGDAMRRLSDAEQQGALFRIEILRIRAVCAFREDRLREALNGYVELQRELDATQGDRVVPGQHRQDYSGMIAEIRRRLMSTQ